MRTRQSVKNIIVTLISYFVTLAMGFISRAYFARLLGAEYLGINGLFSNIISLMSVVELGFGTAVIYNLYRPLSEKNREQIKSLLHFYRRIYRIVACLIVVIGAVIMPFIPLIVGKVSIEESLYFIFALFVADSAASYLLSYKRSIFYADQKNYVINSIHTLMNVCVKVLQIAVLCIWRNYIVFLSIQILTDLLENIIISILANKKYPYLKETNIEKLDSDIRDDIVKKVKGLLFHQIGGSLVQATDNIIMSMTKTLGVIAVGKYSNYVMITTNLTTVMGEAFSSVTASVGNLIVETDRDDVYRVYRRILFANAALCNFVCISLLICIEPFITIWLGTDYLLPTSLTVVITINFYVQGMKRTCGVFRTAAGVFYENRYVPIFEAIINLVTSIVLAQLVGISGIILGTIISSMVHWFYDFPKFVYGLTLHKTVKQYFIDYFPYICVFIVSSILTIGVSRLVTVLSIGSIGTLVLDAIICVIIPNSIFAVAFLKREEFGYWKNFALSKLKRRESING